MTVGIEKFTRGLRGSKQHVLVNYLEASTDTQSQFKSNYSIFPKSNKDDFSPQLK